MSVATCLRQALQLVSGGWSEPFTRDAQGRICHEADEGAFVFCVDGALALSAANGEEFVQARHLLEAIACPSLVAFDAMAHGVAEALEELTSWDWDHLLVDHPDSETVRADVRRAEVAIAEAKGETP